MSGSWAGLHLGNYVISNKSLLTVAKLSHSTLSFLCDYRKLQCTVIKNIFNTHVSGVCGCQALARCWGSVGNKFDAIYVFLWSL